MKVNTEQLEQIQTRNIAICILPCKGAMRMYPPAVEVIFVSSLCFEGGRSPLPSPKRKDDVMIATSGLDYWRDSM